MRWITADSAVCFTMEDQEKSFGDGSLARFVPVFLSCIPHGIHGDLVEFSPPTRSHSILFKLDRSHGVLEGLGGAVSESNVLGIEGR